MRSYRQVGELMGLSHEQVRKIERRALRKLMMLPEARSLLKEFLELKDQHDNHMEEVERYH